MPDRVLAAASTQLCLVGPDALTVEAIAERAHVSIGLVYKHYPSLDQLVLDLLTSELPRVTADIPSDGPLPAPLLMPPPSGNERLLLEALLCIRRFPHTESIVRPVMADLMQRSGPLRCAVLLGCQAITLAGVTIPTGDVTALTSLEDRIRIGDIRPVPPTPAKLTDSDLTVPHPQPERNDPTAVRLREATSDLLTETSGRASVRDIAKKAGVTTGAVYRRYESKDELIGDTIKAAVTADRTNWLQQLFAALMNPTTSDPALVLAQVLATASAPDAEQTRQSIELLVAARGGPAARSALSQRYLTAVETRKTQLASLAATGLMTYPDSSTALAWAFQVAPMGARIAGMATDMPDAAGWYPAMQALLRAL